MAVKSPLRVGMTALCQAVDAVFSAQGVLAQSLNGFRLRPGQQDMAQAVAKVIEEGGVLVVEAGTGVGKTLAYLVPALLSGEKVIISTATKTLQEQLFLRDLPRVRQALGFPVRMALLKGRNSYLCAQRLSIAHQAAHDFSVQELGLLEAARTWAQSTVEGDISELGALQEHPVLAALVTSTRENCLGATCPHISNCHTLQARQRAMQAELVVVNHHLFFADAGVRASGMAELLPSARTVIFDEAHQLSDIGIQFLGTRWSTGQAQSLAQALAAHNSGPVRGLADWLGLATDLAKAAKALQDLVAFSGQDARRSWMDAAPDGVLPQQWEACTMALQRVLGQALEVNRSLSQAWPQLAPIAQRCEDMHDGLLRFSQVRPPDQLRWLQGGSGLSMHQSPLTIAHYMRELLPQAKAQGKQAAPSWIFTSATLGTDAQLSWFVNECGLQGCVAMQVPSPFDYARQAAMYVPLEAHISNAQAHSAEVAALVAQGARILSGRTMVLTTTLRAMRAIAQQVEVLLQDSGIEVLMQGQYAKRLLIENFSRLYISNAAGQDGASNVGKVLIATASFWEGVDIPGDALQLLIIDKLPFAPPNDPLVEARSAAIEQAGGNAFKTIHLAQAALALKQGAGRLIRSETDRGVLVVCDPRLVQKSYGKKLLSGLPPMRTITDRQDWLDALAQLRKEQQTNRPGAWGVL